MLRGIRLDNRVLSFLLSLDRQNSSVYSPLGELLIPERIPVGKALSLFSKGINFDEFKWVWSEYRFHFWFGLTFFSFSVIDDR